MDSQWQPIGDRRDGMLAVTVAATLSFLSIVSLFSFCIFYIRSHQKLSPIERLNNENNRAIKFLTSDYFITFANLIAGDLLQSIGFMIDAAWVARNQLPRIPNHTCTAQALLIQIGDTASAFGSLLVGVHITQILVFSHRFSKRTLYLCIAFEWIVVGILAGMGPAVVQKPGIPFFGLAGGWCWITSSYQSMRLWLHYIFIFVVALINLIQYTIIFIKLARPNPAIGERLGSAPGSASKVMLIYPLVYIITILPLSCFRIAALAGHPWSVQVQLGAGVIFTLSGFANCVVYAFTRKLITVDTVSMVRRVSGSNERTSGPFISVVPRNNRDSGAAQQGSLSTTENSIPQFGGFGNGTLSFSPMQDLDPLPPGSAAAKSKIVTRRASAISFIDTMSPLQPSRKKELWEIDLDDVEGGSGVGGSPDETPEGTPDMIQRRTLR